MAIAASDFAFVEEAVMGPRMRMKIFTWTGPASYASGGESLTTAIGNSLGFKEIHAVVVSRLIKASDGSSVGVTFDHNGTAGTTFGKFRAVGGGVAAHTHDIKAIGGLTSSEALFLDASQSFGKTAATNRTIVGSTSATTGGVVANTAGTTAAELTAATDLSSYTGRVVIYGV